MKQEMNIEELDHHAVEVATRSLQRGFDWQAYLVLKAAQNGAQTRIETPDVVPESTADEGMSEVIARFARYADCKRRNAPEVETLAELESVTDMLRRVVTEIYHLCGSEKERQIVRNLKDCLP